MANETRNIEYNIQHPNTIIVLFPYLTSAGKLRKLRSSSDPVNRSLEFAAPSPIQTKSKNFLLSI